MKRRWAIIGVGVALFLLAWNFPPLHLIPVVTGLEPFIHVYPYQTADGVYQNDEVPEKGRDIRMIQLQFDEYREKQGTPDLVLYRRTKRDWYRFWMWYDYLTNPRWDYPYLGEVEETGG
jgi:hypothetical protein